MTTQQYPQYGDRYKSEMFVPVRQDSHSFEERQRTIWEDMHDRMERRRREWDDEVSRMRHDFFRLRPTEDGGPAAVSARRQSGADQQPQQGDKMDLNSMFYENTRDGSRMFRVSFDVSNFRPEEISVRTQDQRLVVHAKHQEKEGERSVSREFSRQVDIPHNVDPQALRSTLSKDGILQVEAPVAAPAYERIRDGSIGKLSCTSPPPANSPHSPHPALTSGTSPTPSFTERDGTQVFRIVVEVGPDFDPADLTVKTVDRKLLVHARHEEKTPGRTSCREFNREFDLPDAVDPQRVTASMAPDGRLVIEAPIASYQQGSYAGRQDSAKQPVITLAFGAGQTPRP